MGVRGGADKIELEGRGTLAAALRTLWLYKTSPHYP